MIRWNEILAENGSKTGQWAGLLLAVCLSFGLSAQQPFQCNGDFFVVTVTNSGSVLQRFSRQGDRFQIEHIPLSEPERTVTCLGFSVRDLYLYALDFKTYELLRIDAAGKVTSLGVPENLNTLDYDFYAGDVTPTGSGLTIIGRDKKTGLDKITYNISLRDSRHYAGSTAITSGNVVNVLDMARDPVSGGLYGYDQINKKIVALGSGEVYTHNRRSIPQVLAALFFDRDGQMFGYGGTANGGGYTTLYRIDKVSGVAERIQEGAFGTDSDGCSCPYTMEFSRQVTPAEVMPCNEVTIEYLIRNHSGIGRLGGNLRDLLPPVFLITAVEEMTSTLSTVSSAVGSNLFELSNFDIRLGANILRIRALVEPEARDVYEMQASIDNLPQGLGSVLHSDDPATPARGDPNYVRILDPEMVELESFITFNCSGDSATIHAPFPADTYLWSDGSTGPSLTVAGNGPYWLVAGNDCFSYSDTAFITGRPPLLDLDLGPDREVKLGEDVVLSAQSNSAGALLYQWSSLPEGALNCQDCPTPRLSAIENTLVSLTVTNEQGCSASDSVWIHVDPKKKIYLPNTFSPNNDGVNDRLFVQGGGGAIVRVFRVFNRWGTLVFESKEGMLNNPLNGWDGTFGSRPAESGVYIYSAVVRFPDGKEDHYAGDVLLLRR